jgi:uncharacterized repeat protein (TIGR01451 family)
VATAGPYYDGQAVTYTLTLVNAGPDPATGVVVSDDLPAGVTYWSAATATGGIVHGTGAQADDVTWTLPASLAAGTYTARVTVTVNAGEAGHPITNTATETQSTYNPDGPQSSSATLPTVRPAPVRPSTSGPPPASSTTPTVSPTTSPGGGRTTGAHPVETPKSDALASIDSDLGKWTPGHRGPPPHGLLLGEAGYLLAGVAAMALAVVAGSLPVITRRRRHALRRSWVLVPRRLRPVTGSAGASGARAGKRSVGALVVVILVAVTVAAAVVMIGKGSSTGPAATRPGASRAASGVGVGGSGKTDSGSGRATPFPNAQPSRDGTLAGWLAIPALDLRAPLIPTGATGAPGAASLTIPDNIQEVGWWDGTVTDGIGTVQEPAPAPGQPGVAIVAGHVDSAAAGPGAFYDLKHLTVGDTIRVVLAGHASTWKVITAPQTESKTELPPRLFVTTGLPRLALVTCGGPFDWATGHYLDNIIVWAAPAP